MNKLVITKEKSQNILYIIFVLVILYTIYVSSERKNHLKQSSEFTIGKTFKYSGFGGNEDFVAYKYYVNSIEYSGNKRRDYEMDYPLNKFYKVKYSKVKPEISEIYLTQEIIDSTEIVKAGFKYKN